MSDTNLNNWLAYAFVLLGCLFTASGAGFILMYMWEAVISRMGEPDQSLLFWYLPILFIGLIVGKAGLFLFNRGFSHLKTRKNDEL